MIIFKTIMVFIGLLGFLLLGFAGYFSYQNILFFQNGIHTKAKVATTFVRKGRGGSSNDVRVSFKTPDGRFILADSPTAFVYQPDTEVDLYYMPDNPEKILVIHWFSNWWLSVLLGLAGLLLVYIGFAAVFRN